MGAFVIHHSDWLDRCAPLSCGPEQIVANAVGPVALDGRIVRLEVLRMIVLTSTGLPTSTGRTGVELPMVIAPLKSSGSGASLGGGTEAVVGVVAGGVMTGEVGDVFGAVVVVDGNGVVDVLELASDVVDDGSGLAKCVVPVS